MNIGKSFEKEMCKLPHSFLYPVYKNIFKEKYYREQMLRKKEVEGDEYSLSGFDRHKCIFVHIPKSGGVSLAKNLFGNLGGGHRPIYKYKTIFSPDEFNNYFKFAIVRNPWDRLVSAFHFLQQGGYNAADHDWAKRNIYQYEEFGDFVLNWVSRRNIYSYVHFFPQSHFLKCSNKILVNKIYKLEEISDVMCDLERRLDIVLPKEKWNKTGIRKLDYREYYTKKMKDIVADVYREDIELLGYDF